ncbi:amine dehydrogenase large subunit [Pseudomonas entomophila]|uniref:amine dehydrogenase large subunit n=1 Tax=Pseudomonas entomophila TaxID=312306 RepID=UPI0023D858F2|nr:amine dehydrogenase large subunit [Pseudomonas entomophila]MDF0733115.1 amine dehydrogenase large subunit [Pseudomonas entomophila]
MRRVDRLCISTALALAMSAATNAVWADLPAEEIGQEVLPFPPDPHRVYILDVDFKNPIAGKVLVVDPKTKRMLGMTTNAFVAPTALSPDNKALYSANLFYSRGTYGERTDVLVAWDTQTLRPNWEVVLPAKRASTLTEKYALGVSSDNKLVYIFNLTPSTSVTVVDTQTKAVASEIAISGCVLNYPAGKRSFASLCGDGQLQVVTLDDQGKEVGRTQTPFFDPNKVKLNERAIANGDTYYFTTTTGEVYPVRFADGKAEPLPTWSLVTEQERKQGWAPGGWQVLAVAPGLNRLYALMHEQHTDGKWEDPSTTIWAFDLKTGKKVATLESPKPVWSLQASHDKAPILSATDLEGGVQFFDLTTHKHTGAIDQIAATPVLTFNPW